MYSSSLTIVCLLGIWVTFTTSYPTGAPEESCTTFTANHGTNTASNSAPPYTISVSPSSLTSGATATVTLQGTGTEKFKGFFVQGQDKTTKQPVGKFLALTDSQTRDCSGPGSANAITHVNANQKSKIMLQWVAPADYKGTVVFRAVVVKTFEHFWNNVYSNSVIVA